MRDSLFKAATLVPSKAPISLLPQCGACGLFEHCKSPKMKVSGSGRRKILIIGEAPGEDEDHKGVQFVGKTGSELRQVTARLGLDLQEDCWLTNALICRPEDNRKPTPKEIGYCQPNLRRTLAELKPELIIPLGEIAVKSLLGGTIWKESVGKIGRWVGMQIPCRKPNAWICPTWHPSYIVRQKDPAADRIWTRHLERAFKHKGRPWSKEEANEDLKSKICILQSPRDAAQAIAKITDSRPELVSFDLETDRLKPDREDAHIVCCSISTGERTISFPWEGDAVKEMRRFVRSKIKKIAANMKFEDRWIKRILGLQVRRWFWDTMLAAHWIDSRPDITSLKFQAFVNFGIPDYNSHLERYLSGPAANERNQIHLIPMRSLLEYCGLDALIEWMLATKQMKEAGYG